MSQNIAPYAVPSLDDIRQTIDTLDNKIHDLLIERSMLIERISEEKKKNNIQIAQPAREARMIRRLLARHKGPLPPATIIRIWRELVGAVTMLQTGLKVAVCAPHGYEVIWDDARDYFGGAVPMERAGHVSQALVALRDDKVNFAVLPGPELDEPQPWWSNLISIEGANIIGALPYCTSSARKEQARGRGLIVSKFTFSDSGDDMSFIQVTLGSQTSRTRVLDVAKKAGFEVRNLYSQTTMDDHTHHLLEVQGFYADPENESLMALRAGFEESGGAVVNPLGGYPVPPTERASAS